MTPHNTTKHPRAKKSFTFDGRRYWTSGATQQEADEKAVILRHDLEHGKQRISRSMLTEDWADQWLAAYKEPSLSAKAHSDLQSALRVWIKPHLGKIALARVKPLHCQAMLNSMAGMSWGHMTRIKGAAKALFAAALDNGLIESNPANRLAMPRAKKGSHRSVTDEERRLILKVAEQHEDGLWLLVLLYCGLRPCETARLYGRHIDLKRGQMYIDGTKSKAARRYVPIPGVLIPKLREAAGRPFEPLFRSRTGGGITETVRRRMWRSLKKSLEAAGGGCYALAPDLVPYCLRHTYCTDLQAAGVPINVAKEFMGHSSIQLTADIYTHASETAFEAAREKIDLRISGAQAVGEAWRIAVEH